jgi:hypothetical protein
MTTPARIACAIPVRIACAMCGRVDASARDLPAPTIDNDLVVD